MTLEKTDVSKLVATGWNPPTPIVVKARDNQTDLYGLMYKPSTFDPARKYPIVNHIYPGPQTGSVGGANVCRGPRRYARPTPNSVHRGRDGKDRITKWHSKKFHKE